MSKPVRAIVLDPNTQKIQKVEISDWREYLTTIGCHTFTVVSDNPKWNIYCDDNGLNIKGNMITEIEGNYSKLAGVLVFVGKTDGEGADTDLDKNISVADIADACTTAWITT